MATTNGLSSAQSLMRFMGLIKTVPNKDSTSKEEVGTGDNSTTVFWLDNLGVLEGTYTFYRGDGSATATAITETTAYTFDADLSKLTLTTTDATGGLSAVGLKKIWAEYQHNSAEIANSEIINILNAAENKLLRDTDMTFTDTTTLGYKKILNEPIKAHYSPLGKVFDLTYPPVVKIQTTLSEAYTTGGTTAGLTSASLLPSSGTIYIGGNKVAYTAKSGNVLTIPSTTPSIAADVKVRGEVIEVSLVSEGTEPSWTVVDPDTEYEIDYDQGRFKLLDNAYFGEISPPDRIYPSNYLVRVCYMHAWHEPSADPEIPDEINWAVNAIAARKLMGSVVAKAHELGLNDFNPRLIEVDKEAIQEVIDEYSTLNVGTSPYNKQRLT